MCGFVADWPKFYRNKFSGKLIDCTLGLRDRFVNLTQASTNKFLYTFNLRHLFRILHSLALFSPGVQLGEFDLCKLWASEAYRTLGDRLGDREDRRIINNEIRAIATQHFTLIEGKHKLPAKAGRPYYCHFVGPSVDELSFQEVEKLKYLKPNVEAFMADYNETHKSA